jgi:hypothetical protein
LLAALLIGDAGDREHAEAQRIEPLAGHRRCRQRVAGASAEVRLAANAR